MFSNFQKFPNTTIYCELVSRATISAIACAFADNSCVVQMEAKGEKERRCAENGVTNARDNDTIGLPPPTAASITQAARNTDKITPGGQPLRRYRFLREEE